MQSSINPKPVNKKHKKASGFLPFCMSNLILKNVCVKFEVADVYSERIVDNKIWAASSASRAEA